MRNIAVETDSVNLVDDVPRMISAMVQTDLYDPAIEQLNIKEPPLDEEPIEPVTGMISAEVRSDASIQEEPGEEVPYHFDLPPP